MERNLVLRNVCNLAVFETETSNELVVKVLLQYVVYLWCIEVILNILLQQFFLSIIEVMGQCRLLEF